MVTKEKPTYQLVYRKGTPKEEGIMSRGTGQGKESEKDLNEPSGKGIPKWNGGNQLLEQKPKKE